MFPSLGATFSTYRISGVHAAREALKPENRDHIIRTYEKRSVLSQSFERRHIVDCGLMAVVHSPWHVLLDSILFLAGSPQGSRAEGIALAQRTRQGSAGQDRRGQGEEAARVRVREQRPQGHHARGPAEGPQEAGGAAANSTRRQHLLHVVERAFLCVCRTIEPHSCSVIE